MAYEAAQDRLKAAADQLNQAEGRSDGMQVATGLDRGLDTLRRLLYLRLHEDVERLTGKDSMMAPVSEIKAQAATFREIECYQVAESAVAATSAKYVHGALASYTRWLAELRMGEAAAACKERIEDYARRSAASRRLALGDNLMKVMPESTRAPLVLFRLVPLAVQATTALAFQDARGAARVRQAQRTELPSIADCLACRGEVLAPGQQCPKCGNPLWKYELLTAGA
jgi:hypothetical protein